MNENLGPTVQVDFTMAVGSGTLQASANVPSGDVNLTQLLPVLQELSHNIIGSVIRIVENEGHQISCRAGCGACCRQLVPLSLFEAENLADWIRSLPSEQQTALSLRFDAAIIALRDTGILARMEAVDWSVASDERKQVAIDYMKYGVACPFLENESCSIHPIRPFACREYLVTSPIEYCSDPSSYPVVGVPMPLKISSVLYKLGSQIERNQGWIPLVFLFAWMTSGAQPGKLIAGPGPELFYEIIKRLSPLPEAT